MKLTSVELHPQGSSEVMVLSFRDPRRLNPYNVKGIVGLDADEIVALYYGVSGSNAKYYNLSQAKREPVMQIELNPGFGEGQSFSDLRDGVYKMIASSRTGIIEIQFKNGTEVVAVLLARATKVENPLFDKTPGVTISLSCLEPMLKAPTRTVLDTLTLDPASSNIVDAKSTAPHGFLFEIGFSAPQANLTVRPSDHAWSFVVTPSGGFLTGDIVHFSSELNNKYLYVVRGGSTIYLADVVQPGAIWPILFPGDNVFEFDNPTSLIWNAVSFYPTYWGV